MDVGEIVPEAAPNPHLPRILTHTPTWHSVKAATHVIEPHTLRPERGRSCREAANGYFSPQEASMQIISVYKTWQPQSKLCLTGDASGGREKKQNVSHKAPVWSEEEQETQNRRSHLDCELCGQRSQDAPELTA